MTPGQPSSLQPESTYASFDHDYPATLVHQRKSGPRSSQLVQYQNAERSDLIEVTVHAAMGTCIVCFGDMWFVHAGAYSNAQHHAEKRVLPQMISHAPVLSA